MAGILGPLVRLVIFFLCFCCAVAAAAVACSFAGASLARVLLGSGVSRTSAGCARGFYNPLQRRHREGAVPGLRTRQSWCTAPQLNQLLATVSFHQHSHLAFCGYLLWESSSRAPHTLREGAPGSLGVTEPDGVCRLNEPRNRRICERAVRMIDTQLPARAPRSAATALQRRLPVAVGVGQMWGRRASAALRASLQPECTTGSPWLLPRGGDDAQFQVSGKLLC